MDHIFLRLPVGRVLLANVHGSADGKGIGYGMMLIRMRRALLLGQIAHAPVLFVPSRKPINTAVTQLESDDVTIIPPESVRGRWLTFLWWISAPFRIGDPWLWARRSVARIVVGPIYYAVERSPWLPRHVRRVLLGQGPIYRKLKTFNTSYATRSEALWQRTYEKEVLARRRALRKSGQQVPRIRLRVPVGREPEIAREAARLGICETTRLVTVHVRESGYRSAAGLRQRSWDHFRNANIESFFPAFQALVERGYTVVRLGDPTMTPVQRPGVVDLATSPAQSRWLEIWCIMRSHFLVGCDSGPSWLAVLLGVPVLTVNAIHFRDLARPEDRIICKLARDRATGATLSVSEMLTEEFLRVGFKGDRYECLDNTPADLQRAVIDMIEVADGCEHPSSWQNRFRRRLWELERQKASARSALEGVAVMARARGTLSRGFAKKYFVRHSVTSRDTRVKRGSC